MPGKHHLRQQQCDVNADFYPILDKVSTTLVQYDQTMVEVAGHTDSTGKRPLQSGPVGAPRKTPGPRLISPAVACGENVSWSCGDGENHPIASNDTTAGRHQNRRVELTIVPGSKRRAEGSRGARPRSGGNERLTTKKPGRSAAPSPGLCPRLRNCPCSYWLTIPFRLLSGMTRTFLLAGLGLEHHFLGR